MVHCVEGWAGGEIGWFWHAWFFLFLSLSIPKHWPASSQDICHHHFHRIICLNRNAGQTYWWHISADNTEKRRPEGQEMGTFIIFGRRGWKPSDVHQLSSLSSTGPSVWRWKVPLLFRILHCIGQQQEHFRSRNKQDGDVCLFFLRATIEFGGHRRRARCHIRQWNGETRVCVHKSVEFLRALGI